MKRPRTLAAALVFALLLIAAGVATTVIVLRGSPKGVPPELVPPSWAEYRASPGHAFHVGGGKAECKDCHDFQREGFKNPGVAPCQRCHETQAKRAHTGNAEKPTTCLTCHVFAPDVAPPKCVSCHAQPQGHFAAIGVHATTECTQCHRMHEEPSVVVKDCTTCHKQRALRHAEHVDSKGCSDCHLPHTPALAALTMCSTCHTQPAGPRPANHDSCIGCHKPHDFFANGAAACIGCHGLKPTLMADVVPKHAVCTSCHTPHAPMLAAQSCVGCHATVQPLHDGKTACVGCHEPHAGDVSTKVDRCTSCHAKVALADTAAHAGGIACVGCHKPHDFAPPADRRALCATCHAREATLSSTNKGHLDCASCHGASAHTPTKVPICGTCHAVELASAPPGHQACLGCHDPHGGARPPANACRTCHEDKFGGNHAPVAGGCETCHRPHGPSGPAGPPACLTCHVRDKLPALHAMSGHAACLECHTSHGPPRADRATCTAGSCHADRREHQPQALVCDGCHVFRK